LEKPRKPRQPSRSPTPPPPSRSPSKSPTPPDPDQPTQSAYIPNSVPPTVFNSTEYTPRYLPSNPSAISSLDSTTDSVPLNPQPQVSGCHDDGTVWLLTGLQLYNVEINGTWTSAVFDPGSEDSFVSDSFVQSRMNIKSKRAGRRKIWHDSSRNEYHADFGFKASIRVGEMTEILKDQTLYILSGKMGQPVVIGNKIRSNLSSMGSIDWMSDQNQNPRKTSSQHRTMSLPVRHISSTAALTPDVPLYSSKTPYAPGNFTSTESMQLQPATSPLTGNNSFQANYSPFSNYTPPHQSYTRSDYTTSVEGNSSFDSSNYDQGTDQTATSEVAWTEAVPDSRSGNYEVGSGPMSSYSSGQPQDSTESWPSTPLYAESSGQGYYQPQEYKYQKM
jgi:hypothetical protein